MNPHRCYNPEVCAPLHQEAREWDAEFPNHCRTCHGHGAVRMVDHSVGLDGYDPCGDCLGDNQPKCPRCQTELDLTEREPTCEECGWNDDSSGRPIIEEPDDLGEY